MLVKFLKLLKWTLSSSHFLVCIWGKKSNQQKSETYRATRTNTNVSRSATLKSFSPSYRLTPKWFFKWIRIPNPNVPHLLLKNKFPKISLSQNSILPHFTSATLFHWTIGQPPPKGKDHVYFPNAEHDTRHKVSVQLMSITWMSESMNKVLLTSNNFPDGQAKDTWTVPVAALVCSLSRPQPPCFSQH